MADLKGVLDKLAVAMFGPEARTRPRPPPLLAHDELLAETLVALNQVMHIINDLVKVGLEEEAVHEGDVTGPLVGGSIVRPHINMAPADSFAVLLRLFDKVFDISDHNGAVRLMHSLLLTW